MSTLDIAPFAYREQTSEGLVLRWEEPRDIVRLVVGAAAPHPANHTPQPPLRQQRGGEGVPEGRASRGASLQGDGEGEVRLWYWRLHWPQDRVTEEDLETGHIGRAGWKAQADWFNGEWQPADLEVAEEAGRLVITFAPLARSEFPQLSEYNVTFRQTNQVRIALPEEAVPEWVEVYTGTPLVERRMAVEVGCGEDAGRAAAPHPHPLPGGEGVEAAPHPNPLPGGEGEGRAHRYAPLRAAGVEVYNGVLREARGPAGDDPRLHLVVACAQAGPLSHDHTIVTVRAGETAFSFRPEDLERGPIWAPDLGVLVSEEAQDLRWSPGLAGNLRQGLATYDAIAREPEQSLARALREQPPKEPMHFIVGCEGGRQKFGLAPNGDLFAREGFIRRVAGRDTDRLGWEGPGWALRFGWDGWLRTARRIARGYLPLHEIRFSRGPLDVTQEALAAPIAHSILAGPLQGDEALACLLRLTFVNTGDSPLEVCQPLDFLLYEAGPDRLSRNLAEPTRQERLRLEGDLAWAEADIPYLRLVAETGGRGALECEDGRLRYRLRLRSHGRHSIVLKVPFLGRLTRAETAALQAKAWDTERAEVTEYWQARVDGSCRLRTPEPDVDDFFRAHLTHVLINDDHDPGTDCTIGRVSSFNYGNYSNEAVMQIMDLDRRGLHQEARRHLATYLRYQGTVGLPGNYRSQEGVFYGSHGYESGGYNQHHGWVLWGLAEHYRFTGDRDWLLSIAPGLIAGCEWVIRERQATMREDAAGRRVHEYGFLPAGSLEDVTDYNFWLSTNALTCRGLLAAATALQEAGHPAGDRLVKEAEAYRTDLLAGFHEAMVRSPLVRLRDGTYVPHHPSRLYRRGRDFGWIREVLEGSINLTTSILDPTCQEATWILQDYEDNRYLDAPYNYPLDHAGQWFSRGGFSMQPNLLYFTPPYLYRDQVEHFLRAFWNGFASCWRADIRSMCEHPLPTLADWGGDHFKSSDESMAAMWLRMMFVLEQGDDLYLGRGLPRAWVGSPEGVGIARAATYFGPVSLRLQPEPGLGRIMAEVSPPVRRRPARVFVRFRHPEKRRMTAATVNGKPAEFDPDKEWVVVSAPAQPLTVVAEFGEA